MANKKGEAPSVPVKPRTRKPRAKSEALIPSKKDASRLKKLAAMRRKTDAQHAEMQTLMLKVKKEGYERAPHKVIEKAPAPEVVRPVAQEKKSSKGSQMSEVMRIKKEGGMTLKDAWAKYKETHPNVKPPTGEYRVASAKEAHKEAKMKPKAAPKPAPEAKEYEETVEGETAVKRRILRAKGMPIPAPGEEGYKAPFIVKKQKDAGGSTHEAVMGITGGGMLSSSPP
jgi:hypothetical protein